MLRPDGTYIRKRLVRRTSGGVTGDEMEAERSTYRIVHSSVYLKREACDNESELHFDVGRNHLSGTIAVCLGFDIENIVDYERVTPASSR